MDVQQVGNQFVRVYFKTLFENPMTLLSLYKNDSTCSRGHSTEMVSHKGLEVRLEFYGCTLMIVESWITYGRIVGDFPSLKKYSTELSP